jgi:glycosyltransferase involved in cell wall biosynthesis
MVTPYPPSRIRVRPYQLLLGLARRGYTVTLVCPVRGLQEAQDLEALRAACVEVVGVPHTRAATLRSYARALPTSLPLQAAHNLSAPLLEAIRAAARRRPPDVVHVEHLRAAEVARRALAGSGRQIVYDSVDCISLLFERALRLGSSPAARAMALLDLARTRRYEACLLGAFAHTLVTSPEDRWALQTLAASVGGAGRALITVVPNGVDLEYFAPPDTPGEPATLIFSGKLSYHANEAAALYLLAEIMPLVWREQPTARALIAGAGPSRRVRGFAADPRVVVTGYLPDLRTAMAMASIAVCPIRYGVGIQNKVLEAMAMGLPVVASAQATVALNARPGSDLLVARGADAFAAAILDLLQDSGRRAMIGAAGRRYVERHHSWQTAIDRLERVYSLAPAGA